MENVVYIIYWAIAIAVIVGFVIVFLSFGFAFGDKTDLYEDSEGNIHISCSGDFWDSSYRPKYPSKIDWDDLQ